MCDPSHEQVHPDSEDNIVNTRSQHCSDSTSSKETRRQCSEDDLVPRSSNSLKTKQVPSDNLLGEVMGDKTGGDERVNKTIPDWVIKLTQKYNVTVQETAVTDTEHK